jgi:hypothetical protein
MGGWWLLLLLLLQLLMLMMCMLEVLLTLTLVELVGVLALCRSTCPRLRCLQLVPTNTMRHLGCLLMLL